MGVTTGEGTGVAIGLGVATGGGELGEGSSAAARDSPPIARSARAAAARPMGRAAPRAAREGVIEGSFRFTEASDVRASYSSESRRGVEVGRTRPPKADRVLTSSRALDERRTRTPAPTSKARGIPPRLGLPLGGTHQACTSHACLTDPGIPGGMAGTVAAIVWGDVPAAPGWPRAGGGRPRRAPVSAVAPVEGYPPDDAHDPRRGPPIPRHRPPGPRDHPRR